MGAKGGTRVIVPATQPADVSLLTSLAPASLPVLLLCRWEGYLDKAKAANVRKPTRIDKVRTTDLLKGGVPEACVVQFARELRDTGGMWCLVTR